MLVESASIFVVAVLLYIIPLGLRSVVGIVPMISINMVQAISSFMIIYRVAQGTTQLDAHDDMSRIVGQDIENAGMMVSRGRVSVIQFATPPAVSVSSEEGLDGRDAVDLEKGTGSPGDDDSSRRTSEENVQFRGGKKVQDIRSEEIPQGPTQAL